MQKKSWPQQLANGLCVVFLVACGGGADADEGETSIAAHAHSINPTEILAAHNNWRAQVGVSPLIYSDSLAASAQSWADNLKKIRNCNMQHSNGNVGENLSWSSAWSNGDVQNVRSQAVVDRWGAEKLNYTHATNSCAAGKVCGHYTQIVWKKTTEVGCGMAVCESPKNQVWVCQYSPSGNYVGQSPY